MLIAGSIVPCLYYAFYDSLITQIFYMLMTITLCAASVTVSFVDTFSDTKYRTFRASVFTIYAFSSIVPTIHWYLFHSNTELFYDSSFWTAIKFLSLMITLYVTGVLFYALRIPERFSPGKFDFYVRLMTEVYFMIDLNFSNTFFVSFDLSNSFIRIIYSIYL